MHHRVQAKRSGACTKLGLGLHSGCTGKRGRPRRGDQGEDEGRRLLGRVTGYSCQRIMH